MRGKLSVRVGGAVKSHSLGGLDVPEELEVPHGELGGHLHGAELQQGDLTLSEEILSVLVRAQRLRLHVVLQVVPERQRCLHVKVKFRRRGERQPQLVLRSETV